MEPGGTDGVFFRALGIPAFGVNHFGPDDDLRAHGRDERIGIREFEDAVRFGEAAVRIAGGGTPLHDPMRKPGIVIVGAGVMGASAAYHLAARGRRDVLVIDSGSAPGEGSTSRATGGFRAQYGTAINIRLSLLTRSKLLDFADEVGGDCGYVPAGYLWLASSEPVLHALADARQLQRREGLTEATDVTPDGVRADQSGNRHSTASLGDRSARRTDSSGRSESFRAISMRRSGWASTSRGTRKRLMPTERASGRITALITTRRRIATDAVVNAAGAWAGVVRIGVRARRSGRPRSVGRWHSRSRRGRCRNRCR